MKLFSWNVNGIRAVLKKPDLTQLITDHAPDVLCLQETKARAEQVDLPLEFQGYHSYWNSAEKPGYSSTAIFTKQKPLSVTNGLGLPEHDTEGRVITVEYADFYLVTVYTPNSQNELRRLAYRVEWNTAFLTHMKHLEQTKPVIFCGDLNVAHTEIDLARPKNNRKSAGFSDEERSGFDDIIAAGFADSFRHFYPEKTDSYTWWSYRAGARGKNVGWRIDYFCLSQSFLPRLKSASIHADVMGSDHCPVSIEIID